MKFLIIASLTTFLSQVQCKPWGSGFGTLLGLGALTSRLKPPASPLANAASRPVIPILNVRVPKGYKVEVTSGNALTNASGTVVPIGSTSEQPKKGFFRRTVSKVFRKLSRLLGNGAKKVFKTAWSSIENRFKDKDKPITPSETKAKPPKTPITPQRTTETRRTSTPNTPMPTTDDTSTRTSTTSQSTTETRRTSTTPNTPMPTTDSTTTTTSTPSLLPRPRTSDRTETRTIQILPPNRPLFTPETLRNILDTSNEDFPELPINIPSSSTWSIRFAPNSPRFPTPPSLDTRSNTRPLNPGTNFDDDGYRSIRFSPPINDGDDNIRYRIYRYPGLLRDRTFLDRHRFPDTEGELQDLLNRFLERHPEFIPNSSRRPPGTRGIFRVRGPNNEILEERPMTQQEISDFNNRGIPSQSSLLRGPTI